LKELLGLPRIEVLLYWVGLTLKGPRGRLRCGIANKTRLLLSRSLRLHILRLILLSEVGIEISGCLSSKLCALLVLVHQILIRAALGRKLMLKSLLLVLSHGVVRKGSRKTAHVHCLGSAIVTHREVLLRIRFELHVLLTSRLDVGVA
jgi:hypothetical protein